MKDLSAATVTGADILCDTLLVNEVDVCFANPGTSEMHFVAALDRKPAMRCVLGLFEGVATAAADGYARMADKPAATLLHLGPGLANGLANLHNALRARTPVINIVGDHATYHVGYDAPLTSDIESLARPMSRWVKTIPDATQVMQGANEAYGEAVAGRGVATLILPADAAWNAVAEKPVERAIVNAPEALDEAVALRIAQALSAGTRVTFILGGRALRADALALAARLQSVEGVRIFAQTSNARMERGAGRFSIRNLPYPVDAAVQALAGTELLVLLGAAEPVAFFAYPGKPSRLVPEGCPVVQLARAEQDVHFALHALVDRAASGASAPVALCELPGEPIDGALTGSAISAIVARMLPEGAILVDESITSTPGLFGDTLGAAPHDLLALTGGAIGIGIPLAAGAAIACPDRKVVSMQADGSAMYTIQGLWTQARERSDIITVILANRSYNILMHEMRNVGVEDPGLNARRMLNLDDPTLNFADMARGMGVEAVAVDTVAGFRSAFDSALRRRGPFLIQANI